jgi:hypothetical protein
MLRSALYIIAFCICLPGVSIGQDSIVVTDADDIHIVNPNGVTQGVPSPNDGNAKLFAIAGFKC